MLRPRFPRRELALRPHEEGEEHPEEELAIVEFLGADALLQGIEAHADVHLGVSAEFGADFVRGSLEAARDPLPRIPPFRFRAGLQYRLNAWQAGGEVVAVASQDRVQGVETPTAGYTLLNLYRNHLSLMKDVVPEPAATSSFSTA